MLPDLDPTLRSRLTPNPPPSGLPEEDFLYRPGPWNDVPFPLIGEGSGLPLTHTGFIPIELSPPNENITQPIKAITEEVLRRTAPAQLPSIPQPPRPVKMGSQVPDLNVHTASLRPRMDAPAREDPLKDLLLPIQGIDRNELMLSPESYVHRILSHRASQLHSMLSLKTDRGIVDELTKWDQVFLFLNQRIPSLPRESFVLFWAIPSNCAQFLMYYQQGNPDYIKNFREHVLGKLIRSTTREVAISPFQSDELRSLKEGQNARVISTIEKIQKHPEAWSGIQALVLEGVVPETQHAESPHFPSQERYQEYMEHMIRVGALADLPALRGVLQEFERGLQQLMEEKTRWNAIWREWEGRIFTGVAGDAKELQRIALQLRLKGESVIQSLSPSQREILYAYLEKKGIKVIPEILDPKHMFAYDRLQRISADDGSHGLVTARERQGYLKSIPRQLLEFITQNSLSIQEQDELIGRIAPNNAREWQEVLDERAHALQTLHTFYQCVLEASKIPQKKFNLNCSDVLQLFIACERIICRRLETDPSLQAVLQRF